MQSSVTNNHVNEEFKCMIRDIRLDDNIVLSEDSFLKRHRIGIIPKSRAASEQINEIADINFVIKNHLYSTKILPY